MQMQLFATTDAFVATAREDLGYEARWWQLLRKHKEKRFLRSRELDAGTR
ncbi:hypothetical protein ACFCX4_05250 [Kitasatospora sp. NPDC056327]